MNRVDAIFESLRRRRAKALMPFVTAGDPDLATTEALLPVLEEAGASVCELGIPFSDPIADGPVVQASMTHALRRGVRPGQVLEMVTRVRPRLSMGLMAMISYSIVHRLKPGAFIKSAQEAGIDGFIFPDLPVEEADAIRDRVREAGLVCSFMIAPTTPIERAEKIAQASSGFVYVLARAGITGERSSLPADLAERIERLRGVTDLPIAVGFGISSAEMVRQVVAVADAAIVGSAIMRRVAAHRDDDRDAVIREVREFVRELAMGLDLTPQPAQ